MAGFSTLVFALSVCVLLGNDSAEPLEQAEKAYQAGQFEKARELAEKAVEADPKQVNARMLLGLACSRLRDQKAALEAFNQVLKMEPNNLLALDRRGDTYLKLGEFDKAVADFDRVLEIRPQLKPEHWRRGIALYYTGDHKEGAKQFETHKEANPEDVENAAWHYLCNANVIGREKARAELIDVTKDTRVPMAEIQKLFAGKMEPGQVIKAAERLPMDSDAGKEARFYAHLYVGLWYEAEGKGAEAKKHLTEAVEKYEISHYMWDVGKAHLQWLAKKAE